MKKKYLIRFWTGSPTFEETKKKKGKYVTVKLTPRIEEGVTEQTFSLFKDGNIHISCTNYEIIGSESSNWWFKAIEFIFDETILAVSPVEGIENIRFSFPKLIEE
jgi:hypothetical protein